MSFLSDVWSAVEAVFRAIVGQILQFIRDFWAVILVVLVIYFAPVIAPWLASVGAPQFLVDFFASIGTTITPLISTLVDAAWSGLSGMALGAYSTFADLSIGTQAAWVVGVAALIAPSETAQVVSDVVDTVSTVVGGVVAGVSSGLGLGTIALVVGGFWLLSRHSGSSGKGAT